MVPGLAGSGRLADSTDTGVGAEPVAGDGHAYLESAGGRLLRGSQAHGAQCVRWRRTP